MWWCLVCGAKAATPQRLLAAPCTGWVQELPAEVRAWLMVQAALEPSASLGAAARAVVQQLLVVRLQEVGLAPVETEEALQPRAAGSV